jgi:hypothetical protein
MLKAQIKMVADGGDSIGVCFGPAKALVKIRSGDYYLASQQA